MKNPSKQLLKTEGIASRWRSIGAIIPSPAARIAEQTQHLLKLAQQARELDGRKAAAEVVRQERIHCEIVSLQQEMIATQKQLLSEARKDKWQVALLVGILCTLLGAVVSKLLNL